MLIGNALYQMSASAERCAAGDGEAIAEARSDEARPTRHSTVGAGPSLLAQVLARENMQRAWKRVKANKGAAGVDGLYINATVLSAARATPNPQALVLYVAVPIRTVGFASLGRYCHCQRSVPLEFWRKTVRCEGD